jgi:YjbE family integral membrane protein
VEPALGGSNSLTGILQITLVDLILAGDNAVVIGVVASRLQGRERRLAIMIGAGGAVVLRVGLAIFAVKLLELPALAAVGGALLFWIGWRLLRPEGAQAGHEESAISLRQAIQLVIVADVVMSLDNVLAVAAASGGNVWLLVFGISLSIPLLFLGAGLIARVSDRFPFILYLGSALIFRIGTVLILEDQIVHPLWEPNFFLEHLLPWIVFVVAPVIYLVYARLRGLPTIPLWVNPRRRSAEREPPTERDTSVADPPGG